MTDLATYRKHFWERVNMPSEGCWDWMGSTTSNGYGHLSIPVVSDPFGRPEPKPSYVGAHVVAWALSHDNKWPEPGQVVRHTCDRPICCNPDHLEIGSQMDNMRDRGERSDWNGGKRKLTREQVHAIRHSGRPQTELARTYGVSQATISNVQSGKSYREFINPVSEVAA